MRFINPIKYIFLVFVLTSSFAFAQEDDNLGTEVVNVVKPYTAAVSDAFKIKEAPVIQDEENTKKETIEYNIFSFPVASTFTPAKGKAAALDEEAANKFYDNYATLGFGNYGTIIGELYLTKNLNKNAYVGGMIRHHSSQGGIKDVVLDDNFSNTQVDVTYGNVSKSLAWNADVGYQTQTYNWYGLLPFLYTDLTPESQNDLFSSIDPKQTYSNMYVGGRFALEGSAFQGGEIKFNRFWDGYDSGENNLVIKPDFAFDVMNTTIKTRILVDHLSGSFENNPIIAPENSLDYSITNFGLAPSISLQQNGWDFNLGAQLIYSSDSENSKSKFFIYPEITASYNLVGDFMILYGGIEGMLRQNSYRNFATENPFVSPNLFIAPTDQQYDFFAGLKGKLASNISYNVRGSYMSEKNRAFFINNRPNYFQDPMNYDYGNSFGILYDDLKTITFFGELKADISKDFSAGINASIMSYSVTNSEEAWNLPSMKISATSSYQINEKWNIGAQFFYVGQRKDLTIIPPVVVTQSVATIDGYFDLNAQVYYTFNKRISAFVKANNIANQAYERWINYPAQQFQILAGANFKFDF
uniref:TonB-dependent receptor n=1 Tax=Flavobacterium sp. TaxID=239 RepID=UPI00404B7D3E